MMQMIRHYTGETTARQWRSSGVPARVTRRPLVVSAVVSLAMVCCGSRVHDGGREGVLPVSLDTSQSCMLLATEAAFTAYTEAIEASRALHAGATVETFTPEDLASVKTLLQTHTPYYVQLFMLPQELDVNFNWRWLAMTAALDDDPFVDTRTGIITGQTPEEAARFVQRISHAASRELQLPAMMIDNLGPNPQAKPGFFNTFSTSYFLPVLGNAMGLKGISHGAGYRDEWLDAMDDAGVIHLGGHGHPDGIDDGMTASQARRATLDPCVVFSGVCYTGVCGRWFDMYSPEGTVVEKMTAPDESFCLQLLANNVIGYLAALHPDHGIPVYQEMEYMAQLGASLGEVIKYTYDGVVLGNGGALPEFELLKHGMASPQWTPAQIMLFGTASRVLLGDPSLRVLRPLDVPAPLEITVERKGSSLVVGALMNNPEYKALFTDTYHDYLAFQKNMFNDRALVSVGLPGDFGNPASVKVLGAAHGPTIVRHQLQGWGVEHDAGRRILHVQVDLATTGYMESQWRAKGAAVGIEVQP